MRSITALSFGNLGESMNTPLKNPYWNGDHACTVIRLRRQ